VATTRSPTSNRRSPLLGFSFAFRAALSLESGGASMHGGYHLHLLHGYSQRAWDRVGHKLNDAVRGIARPTRRDDDHFAGRIVHRWEFAATNRCREACDRATLGLPVERHQLGYRDHPESIRSPSTRPGPIEGNCAASPTRPGAFRPNKRRARRPRARHRASTLHRRPRRPRQAATRRRARNLRRSARHRSTGEVGPQQPMDRRGRSLAKFFQPLGGAPGRAARATVLPARSRATRSRQPSCSCRYRTAGQHADAAAKCSRHRRALSLVERPHLARRRSPLTGSAVVTRRAMLWAMPSSART